MNNVPTPSSPQECSDHDILIEIRTLYGTVAERIEGLQRQLTEQQERFVTKDAFTPVRNVVYGLVGLLGAGVVGALLTVIFKTGRT